MTAALALVLAVTACTGDDTATPRQPADNGRALPSERGRIVIHTERPARPFDDRLLGTNVPAWLGPERLSDPELVRRVVELGTTVVRMPGGSWSNSYDWEACETGDSDRCYWTWAARPTDYVDFLQATGIQGMWTVSANGTAQEAAALVAFFNGELGDTRRIGRDRRGRDWGTVGEWAALRAAHGNPEPDPVLLWEVGNELYGATPDAGPECAEFGWEQVWTCDGAEYVEGTEDHDGFLEIRAAMRAIDPRISVGAVGVADPDAWGSWGDEVLAAGKDQLDFYIIHHYAFDSNPSADEALAVPRATWPAVVDALAARTEALGFAAPLPIAVTEHNLVAFLEGDGDALMSSAVNSLYLAESIGRMAESGIPIANQWNLANGQAASGTDYGLLDVDTFEPYPAYHGLAIWRDFGNELLEVSVGFEPSKLSVYAGRSPDGTIRLVIINLSASSLTAELELGSVGPDRTSARVVRANSLTATELELSEQGDGEAPAIPGPWQFPAWSITSVTIHPMA